MIIALAVTFFLAFIDEGYYSMQWMSDPGNWVAFAIYVLIFFVPLFFLFGVLLGKHPIVGRTAADTIVGLVAISVFVLMIF